MLKKNQFALKTLISGFILHFILGTFHLWQTLLRYFNSYLLEFNNVPIPDKYLEIIFSLSNVPHGLFMILGVLLTGYYSSLQLTGFGLIIRIISETMYILFPDINIVTANILISSSATGLIYLPIMLDILRYYPNSKGQCISFAMSGFAINRLMFKYISIYIIDPDSIEMIRGTRRYPSIINSNFHFYLKVYLIFFSLLSVLCIYLLHPYQPRKIIIENDGINDAILRKFTTDPTRGIHFLNIDKNFKEEDDSEEINFSSSNELESEIEGNYIRYLLSRTNKKSYKKSDQLKTIKQKKLEPFSSLIISYPFLQLTFIFFFTMLIGLVELSSIRKLGSLNGHSEIFLWNTSFFFKGLNAVGLPIWGFFLDKYGFKNLYSIVLSVQLIISSLCFFISSNTIGFILFNGISAMLHSVNLSIQLTTYVLIFGNEKGVLLYSIGWLLIYIFYIARPFISNIFVSKIYFLAFYITLSLFTMIALIILSFFEEKKHNYEDKDRDSSSESEKEMEELQFDKSDDDSEESDEKNNKNIFDKK